MRQRTVDRIAYSVAERLQKHIQSLIALEKNAAEIEEMARRLDEARTLFRVAINRRDGRVTPDDRQKIVDALEGTVRPKSERSRETELDEQQTLLDERDRRVAERERDVAVREHVVGKREQVVAALEGTVR